jgi:hypothetical protein
VLPCLAVAAGGAWLFDAGYPVAREIEALMSTGLPQWQQAIPRTSTVYWQGPITYPWFVLRRASYLSVSQAAGVVFSRAAAMEVHRRLAYTSPAGLSASDMAIHRTPRADRPDPVLTVAGLRRLCADPGLGHAVLRSPLDGTFAATLHERATGVTYHLFDCARIRDER